MVCTKKRFSNGRLLAVILANLWLKEYEAALKKEVPKLTGLNEVKKEVYPGCQKKVTYRIKGVECEACLTWYHLGSGNISESEYADIDETVWYCIACKKQQEADRAENGVKVFLRYVDDIVRTVKGDPELVLEAANNLHPNLQFTIEELDSNDNLAFLDLNVNVDSGKISEVAHPCITKKTSLKGRFIGFSEVSQHGKILTRHWKKNRNNGLKINIRKNGRTV